MESPLKLQFGLKSINAVSLLSLSLEKNMFMNVEHDGEDIIFMFDSKEQMEIFINWMLVKQLDGQAINKIIVNITEGKECKDFLLDLESLEYSKSKVALSDQIIDMYWNKIFK